MKFKYDKILKKGVNWKRIFPIVFAVLFLLSVIGWLGLRQWYQYNLKPLSQQYQESVVVIEPGSSVPEIASQLEDSGLIRSATAFNWYVGSLSDEDFLKAGTYKLSPSFSAKEIVQMLVDGKVDTSLVTIYPGRRLDQIADDLVESGFDRKDVDLAINAKYGHPLFADKPSGSSLEGYIFPDTYQITAQSTARSVIEQSFNVFYDKLSNDMMAGIHQQGLNLYEAITLASMVQKEVSSPDIQKQVAQVFLKRLHEGMVLGSDVTFLYAAEIKGVEPTIDIDSPYNTRINPGLPPGPISNFNITALEAVAHPADGNYLYFVAGDDGKVYFANTLGEHESNIAKYCHEGCKL